jgi:hypothetical protein
VDILNQTLSALGPSMLRMMHKDGFMMGKLRKVRNVHKLGGFKLVATVHEQLIWL